MDCGEVISPLRRRPFEYSTDVGRNLSYYPSSCNRGIRPSYDNLFNPISGTIFENQNRNHKLQISKAPLKSQAQGTSLFTSATSNQRGFPKNSPWEAQVRL